MGVVELSVAHGVGRYLAGAFGTSMAAVAEDVCFGVVPGREHRAFAVVEDGTLCGVAVTSGRYLRFAHARDAEVWQELIAASLEEIRGRGHSEVVAFAEPGNYVTPGIPANDLATQAALLRAGFSKQSINTNLLARLSNLAAPDGEGIEHVTDSGDPVISEIEKTFGSVLALECARAASRQGLFVRRIGGELVGFAAHSGNNALHPSFGPAATVERLRGQGLGKQLAQACFWHMKNTLSDDVRISWIGPRKFYEKIVDVYGSEEFVVMKKSLGS